MARIGPAMPQAMLRSSGILLPTTCLAPRAPVCKRGSFTGIQSPKPLQKRPSRAIRASVQPKAIFYGGSPSGSSGRSNFDHVAAAPPQSRQALLSNAISSCKDWRQLEALVEQYGKYLTANNISHCLTRLEQLLAGQQLSSGEAVQVEELLQWLMQQGMALNATGQLGPQALGATAGALARLQEAQRQQQLQRQWEDQLMQYRQQQQQQQQLQQQMLAKQRLQQQQQQEAVEQAKRAAAEDDRRQLMQQLVDAAVAQRSRLSPQALDNILSGLASIDESGMSTDEIRQLLNIPKRASSRSSPTAGRSSLAGQQQQRAEAAQLKNQQEEEREWQQQQRPQQQQQQQQQRQAVVPGDLRAAARQLGQLSPELAEEWHDRALKQSLERGTFPAGLDQRYLAGFLAREIDRAAARFRDSSSSSSSGGGGGSVSAGGGAQPGAALLQGVLVRYAQLLRLPHFALIAHRLAELQEEGLAGTQQEVESVASQVFQLSQSRVQSADAASISSLISSCKELRLYSKTLVSAALERAKTLLQAQLQGYQEAAEGFGARQLGVLLHSLAVLGLRPSDAWLRLAVLAAGHLLPSCSLTDLERLASAFVLMRVSPGSGFTAAAEAQLEQLAAAIGSSKGYDPVGARTLVGLSGDADDQAESDSEDDAGQVTSNARKALAACVKAVALLGGQRAAGWYNSILAEQQQQQQQQQEEEQRKRQQQAAAVEQRRQQQQAQQRQQEAEKAMQRQQEMLKQQQQGARVTSEEHLEKQLRKAVAQQQQRHGNKSHLHSHHHVQHKHAHKQDQPAVGSGSSKGELNALSSLDELMGQELQQQQQQQQQAAGSSSSSHLPHVSIPIQEASAGTDLELSSGTDIPTTQQTSSSSSSSRDTAARGARSDGVSARNTAPVESAAPAAWAAEQSARWADTEGQQLRLAAELQQRLDDSKELFGGSNRSSSKQQQQRKGTQAASPHIEVQFEDQSSSTGSSTGRQQQRSAADAASALAALMAEVDNQEVDESAQDEVQRELDAVAAAAAAEDSGGAAGAAADGAMLLQDIQAAADAVQQAAQQLDELQRRQQQQQEQLASGGSSSKHHSRNMRHKKAAAHSSLKAAAAAPAAAHKPTKPLGFSREAAFVAAAKNLASTQPSRNYLLGCLEAIEMQRTELKQQLAAKQAMEAVAGAVQRQRTAAALDKNPLAKQIAQLQADFDRARKRAADEKAGITSAAVADVATKLMPLLDSFDAALAAQQTAVEKGQVSATGDGAQIHTVYQGLNNQLLTILKSQGVTVIGDDDADVVGAAFDPAFMEAVMRQPAPAGFADGDVLCVLRKGYAVGDKLVRPALVVVAYED